MLAIMRGEFSAAETDAEAALVAGQEVQGQNAEGVYGVQLLPSAASKADSQRWHLY
jgi:hypothetical protein